MPAESADAHRRLVTLMHEVKRARRELRGSRPQPFSRDEQRLRSLDLLDALTTYAEAAHAAGAPLPYQHRDEIRLLQGLHPRFPGRS